MTDDERAARLDAIYQPENRKPERSKAAISPSGRYVLCIEAFATGSHSWDYTLGFVATMDKKRVIAEVRRNYSSFPFCWLEDHPVTHHDYLICGSDYQGQTVVDLNTGYRVDYRPPEAAKGHGFCWASYTLSSDKRTLAVDGCYWASPDELVFYDVGGDPMVLPFPEIERLDAELLAWADDEPYGWLPDGTYRYYVHEPGDWDAEMTWARKQEAAGGKDTNAWDWDSYPYEPVVGHPRVWKRNN